MADIPQELIEKIKNMKLCLIINEGINKYYDMSEPSLKTFFNGIKSKYNLEKKDSKFVGKMLKYLIYKDVLIKQLKETIENMGISKEALLKLENLLKKKYKVFNNWVNPDITFLSKDRITWNKMWKIFIKLRNILLNDNETVKFLQLRKELRKNENFVV